MSQELFCYQNGKILPASQMSVSPWDLGFLRGYGVFDVMAVMNGRPFLLDWHFARLEHSASELSLRLPVSKSEYVHLVADIIRANAGTDIILRTVLSGGISTDAFSREAGKEHFLILAEPFVPLPASLYSDGAKVMTLTHTRSLPRVKMTQYVMAIRSLQKRQEFGALETLYVENGTISECAQSNFFIVAGGKIITTTDNALLGITQKLLCEVLVPQLGLIPEIRPILSSEVLAADEAFLTGSNKHIVPVVSVDENVIGTGKPGPLTRQLMALYREYVEKF